MNKSMIIEEALEDKQIETVEKLASEIWNQHFIPIIGKVQVDYMLEKFQSKKALSEQIKQGYLYFLIKTGNDDVGYLGVLPKKNELFLSKFYIRFSERGKGFGKKTLQFVEKLAEEKGLHKLTLTVNKNNTSSINAYEKMGFTNTGGIVQNIGNNFIMDDYKMEKLLKGKQD